MRTDAQQHYVRLAGAHRIAVAEQRPAIRRPRQFEDAFRSLIVYRDGVVDT